MKTGWSDVSQMAITFQQTGPFFVSLLFLIVISAWARSAYKGACERKDPPPTEREVDTYRAWFAFSVLFGSALTLAAVVYWFVKEPVYTASGVVHNLADGEALWGGDANGTEDGGKVYVRPIFFSTDPIGPNRNDNFIIIRHKPFSGDETFQLHYKKPEGRNETLSFRYAASLEFEVDWDKDKHINVLKPVGGPPAPQQQQHAFSLSLIPAANAQMLPSPSIQSGAPFRPTNIQATLQDERVYAGREIAALDAILNLKPKDKLDLLSSNGNKEPMLITMLDLTRHSDDELAYKASAVLKGVDVNTIVRKKLLDSDATTRARFSTALLRLPTAQALAIVSSISKPSRELAAIKTRLSSAWTPRLLSPVSSGAGDLYWLTAACPSRNPKAGSCMESHLADAELTYAAVGSPLASFSVTGTRAMVDDWMIALSGNSGMTPAFYLTSFQTAFNNAGARFGYALPASNVTKSIVWDCKQPYVYGKTDLCTTTIVSGIYTYTVGRDTKDPTKVNVVVRAGVAAYSHSKDWVLAAADAVERCGGTVTFTRK